MHVKSHYLWTAHNVRLQLVGNRSGKPYHWFFLPGGPGLGSEYFFGLTHLLEVPGCLWHLDLPGSGSNKRDNGFDIYGKWKEMLIEAMQALEPAILVAHSFGGMLALTCPELEKVLKGLILLNTSPISYSEMSQQLGQQHQLPDREESYHRYARQPSNETMRQYCHESIPYWFTPSAWETGRNMVEDIPLNYQAYQMGASFLASYKAQWVPQHLKTCILLGEKDFVTPPCLFEKDSRFHRPNIWLRTISQAGHFPWIEDPKQVAQAFWEYSEWLDHRFQPDTMLLQ